MEPAPVVADDDRPHPGALADEWVFTAWEPDAGIGLVTGLRVGGTAHWYWAAMVGTGRPLLHVADFEVPPRADPLLVKSPGLWAEHVCDEPLRQWTVANETYATALDDPDEALGRAFGVPAPIAMDLEWYATAEPEPLAEGDASVGGFRQRGVVHGTVELAGGPGLDVAEIPAERWRRWRTGPAAVPATVPALPALPLRAARAHAGLRAPFAFPDGTVADLVLTPDGFRRRVSAEPTSSMAR